MKVRTIDLLNIIIIIGVLLSYFLFFFNVIDFKAPTIFLTLFVTITLYLLYKNRYGFLFSYLFYLFLTNFGIYITNVFIEDPFVNYHGELFWYSFNFNLLFSIASFGVLFFTLICNFISYRKNGDNRVVSIDKKGNQIALKTGVFIIVFYTFYFLYLILTGKLIITNYGEFRNTMETVPSYSYMLIMFTIGVSLAFANVDKQKIKYLFILLIPQTFLFLFSGNRGEIFFPLLAAIGVLITKGYKVKWWASLSALFMLFILVPFIKTQRNAEGLALEGLDLNWFDALVEIGYSLRPLGYIVMWTENGESYSYGASYWAPFQNIISNVLPFIERIVYTEVPYGFRYRLPTMGFNAIAEAYYNGGLIGIILFFSAILLIFYKLNNTKSFILLSFATGLLSIFITNIRNSFSSVPGFIVILTGIITIIYMINKITKVSNKNEEKL